MILIGKKSIFNNLGKDFFILSFDPLKSVKQFDILSSINLKEIKKGVSQMKALIGQ